MCDFLGARGNPKDVGFDQEVGVEILKEHSSFPARPGPVSAL